MTSVTKNIWFRGKTRTAAARSYSRVLASIARGLFKDEILPVSLLQRKGDPKLFDTDECPRNTIYEILAQMKPAFQKDGYATAGNASVIADGASALCIMAERKARERGLEILARIGAQGSSEFDMKYVPMARMLSIPKVAKKGGVNYRSVDLMEINEAFAGSTVGVIRELGLEMNHCNIMGGSVALGHPIGASGARLLTTLVYSMKHLNKKTGMASLCLGGGEAVSLYVEC